MPRNLDDTGLSIRNSLVPITANCLVPHLIKCTRALLTLSTAIYIRRSGSPYALMLTTLRTADWMPKIDAVGTRKVGYGGTVSERPALERGVWLEEKTAEPAYVPHLGEPRTERMVRGGRKNGGHENVNI
jgi:hypothetical protein